MYLSIITIFLLGSVAFGFFGIESEVCILKLWLLFFLLCIIFAIICGFAYLAYLLWLSFKYNYSINLLFNIINLFIYLFISYIIYTVYYKSNNIFNKENHKKICDFFLLNPFVSNHKILKNDISIFSSSNFKSWVVSSKFIIILIIGISYFNSSYLVPAVNSFHNYIQLGFLAFALVLLLIYKSKIFSFFNKKNILNKFLFFLYVFSWRFILIYIATEFLVLIDIELSKFILLILTTEGFFFLFKPVLCEYLGLFSSMLVNLLTNWNLYFQTLPDFITSVKQLIIGLINYRYINVRIKPFCTRITNGNKLPVNIELGVLSMLNKPYFPSFFQPLSLPFVCPSMSTIMQGKILKSPVLLNLLLNSLLEGETRVYSWNCETIVVSDWDGQTVVGSDWENEIVVGSENNLDLKVCLDSCASSKLRDPQLNFSLEYLNENRVQSVFVNKGKGIATNLDLNCDSVENSQNLAQDIASNEVADMSDENINIAINESRQTYRYNTIIGESSSRGGNLSDRDNDSDIELLDINDKTIKFNLGYDSLNNDDELSSYWLDLDKSNPDEIINYIVNYRNNTLVRFMSISGLHSEVRGIQDHSLCYDVDNEDRIDDLDLNDYVGKDKFDLSKFYDSLNILDNPSLLNDINWFKSKVLICYTFEEYKSLIKTNLFQTNNYKGSLMKDDIRKFFKNNIEQKIMNELDIKFAYECITLLEKQSSNKSVALYNFSARFFLDNLYNIPFDQISLETIKHYYYLNNKIGYNLLCEFSKIFRTEDLDILLYCINYTISTYNWTEYETHVSSVINNILPFYFRAEDRWGIVQEQNEVLSNKKPDFTVYTKTSLLSHHKNRIATVFFELKRHIKGGSYLDIINQSIKAVSNSSFVSLSSNNRNGVFLIGIKGFDIFVLEYYWEVLNKHSDIPNYNGSIPITFNHNKDKSLEDILSKHKGSWKSSHLFPYCNNNNDVSNIKTPYIFNYVEHPILFKDLMLYISNKRMARPLVNQNRY